MRHKKRRINRAYHKLYILRRNLPLRHERVVPDLRFCKPMPTQIMVAKSDPHGGRCTSTPVEVGASHFFLIFEPAHVPCTRLSPAIKDCLSVPL